MAAFAVVRSSGTFQQRRTAPTKQSKGFISSCYHCVLVSTFVLIKFFFFFLTQKMRLFVVLLYALLFAAPDCTGLTTTAGYMRNFIHRITSIVMTTQVHIHKLSKEVVDPETNLSPPSIQGLTSIGRDLGLLDNELRSPFTELLSQIQADVSSLEGAVHFLASTMGCNIQDKPPLQTREHPFPDGHHHQMLREVQHYMDHLLLNKDKLKVC
ncbi:leptin b [Gouania willdenowi]|uniref:leptin b n=1 Tax=Gouania willdenowi TaxID=441366 RepID=UPI0010565352|nr:leptin-B-like [Gouania willdenowi]